MKKKKQFERMNLYIDQELSRAIKRNAERDFLRKTTWVTQYLRKSLLGENNHMSNLKEDES